MGGASERVVIVGGGFAGLAIATRLAQSGLPVTLLEAGQLGVDASTLNQGWLHSGAFFACDHLPLARMCHESLEQTLRFCPEAIEPATPGMLYVFSSAASQRSAWTNAWEAAGIPYETLSHDDACRELAAVDSTQIRHAYRLPDRSFRPHVLLETLAAAARGMGAEIRTQTPVTEILRENHRVYGVRTGAGEEVRASRVVLATGASIIDGALTTHAGEQTGFRRVILKTHLISLQPQVEASPFCVIDDEGFNHLPHWHTSVFGNGRWPIVQDAGHRAVDAPEIDRVWEQITRYFPDLDRAHYSRIREWAGTTLQMLHVDQVEPGRVPLPTIVNHQHEGAGLENLWSVAPGRATLWTHLAEEFREVLLNDLGSRVSTTAKPPWSNI